MANVTTKNKKTRKKVLRSFLERFIHLSLSTLTDLDIDGQENFPLKGPVLVVANHFSFIDPLAVIRATPRPIEFVGGFNLPNAPAVVRWIPRLWGYYPVYRGSVSRGAIVSSQEILSNGGVLGIFPEAGSWAKILRPARPGAAVIALRTGAQIIPIGIDGATEVFPKLRQGKRAKLTIRVGKPFGPYKFARSEERDRKKLNLIGDEIMNNIAELLPPEKRGYYSDDPKIKEASLEASKYPWEFTQEGG